MSEQQQTLENIVNKYTENQNNNSLEFLNKCEYNIKNEIINVGKSLWIIAENLETVYDNKLYAVKGLSFEQWVETEFKFRKSYAYNLLNIAKRFADKKLVNHSIFYKMLKEGKQEDNEVKDFSASQVIVFNKVKGKEGDDKYDKLIEKIKTGEINPNLSVRDIEIKVREIIKPNSSTKKRIDSMQSLIEEIKNSKSIGQVKKLISKFEEETKKKKGKNNPESPDNGT